MVNFVLIRLQWASLVFFIMLALALTLLQFRFLQISLFAAIPSSLQQFVNAELLQGFTPAKSILTLAALSLPLNQLRLWGRRKQGKNSLEDSQRDLWFRIALESSFDSVYWLRAVRDNSGEIIDFEFLDLNEQGAKLVSLHREEILHQRLCELLPINRTLGFFERYKRVVETGIPLEEEFCAEAMPGVTAQWLRHQVVQLGDGIVIVSRDVTARKQAEIEIAAREKLYRALAESMTHYVMQLDVNGKIKYVNPQWQRDLGVTAEQINQQGWSQILHPEEAPGILSRWQYAFERGESITEEFRYRMADGSYRWFSGQLLAVKDEQGSLIHWIGSATDINDRKLFEQTLKQREQKFRTLAENSPDIIARIDRDLRHLYVNSAITKATGLAPEALIGKSHAELDMPSELVEFWQSKLKQVFATGQSDSYEFNFPAPDGTRYYLARIVPEFSADGEVETLLGITSDITDLKQAELAIQQSEVRFRRVVESNMIGMGFWNLAGDILSANDALLTMLGYTQEECRHQPLNWRTITPHEYDTIENKALQEIAEHGFCKPFEKEYIRKDGSRIPILCGGAAFEGSAESGIFFVLDLTERKKIEAECERLLKLERAAREEVEAASRIKDEFLAAVSHELRTPLSPILGWLELLKSQSLDADKSKRALAVIERNAQWQAQLVEDLLDISQILQGRLHLTYCPVNLTETVESAIAAVRLSAEAKSIQFYQALNPATGPVLGNACRIQQVIWNLLSNAIKFTPAGGRVEIALEPVGLSAQIRVSDTGQGIKPEFLPYVFDYFRQSDGSITRQFGGLGLGLAISRYLVELHGGTIEAASMGVNKGAVFTVRFPLLQNELDTVHSPKWVKKDL